MILFEYLKRFPPLSWKYLYYLFKLSVNSVNRYKLNAYWPDHTFIIEYLKS